MLGKAFNTSRLSKLVSNVDFKERILHPAPPDATVEMTRAVDEPGKLYAIYRNIHRCRLLLGMIFLIGSLTFDVVLPIEIGQLIKIFTENLSESDFND